MDALRTDKAEVPAHWRQAVRTDIGRLRKAERTPTGGYRVPGAVARAGILEYRKADGTVIRELVPPEEIRSLDSLATLRDAAVTVGHPDEGTRMVTPDTYRQDACGHVSGEPRADGEDHVLASLAVTDAETIQRIDAGELTELSSGYRCYIDPTPGTWDGERYDQVQRQRTYNHVALLPAGGGRAGETVSLRLDGEDVDTATQLRADRIEERDGKHCVIGESGKNFGCFDTPEEAEARLKEIKRFARDGAPRGDADPQLSLPGAPQPQPRFDMETETIDGVSYKVGSDEWRQAIARERKRKDEAMAALEDEKKTLDEEKKKADMSVEEMKAARDALQKTVDELKEKIAEMESEAEDPERMDSLVQARLDVLDRARAVLGDELKADGKKDTDLMVEVLEKVAPETVKNEIKPGLEVEDKTDDKYLRAHAYLRARFDVETEKAREERSSHTPITRARGDAFGTPQGGGTPPAAAPNAPPFQSPHTIGREPPPDLSTRYQRTGS